MRLENEGCFLLMAQACESVLIRVVSVIWFYFRLFLKHCTFVCSQSCFFLMCMKILKHRSRDKGV